MRVRRPFAVAGFSALGALIAAAFAGLGASAALGAFCALLAGAVLFGLPRFRLRAQAALALFAASLALLWFCLAQVLWVKPAAALAGETAVLSGVIADEPQQSYGSYYYSVKADSITVDGKATGVRATVRLKTASPLAARPFDRITAKAALTLPPAQGGSGYTSRMYYQSKGVYLFAAAQGASVAQSVSVAPASARPLYYQAIRLRVWISDTLQRLVGGREGALAAGILIGDTSGLPQSVSDDFSATGISHILAVSGTQVSLLMEYLLLLLAALRLPRRLSAVVTMAAVAGFMALTGFSASVMRAGLMGLLCLAGVLVRREADTLNALGFAVLALCAANPFAAADVGLLLSAFATLGMVLVSPRLYRPLRAAVGRLPRAAGFLRAPCALLCETAGATLLTYPVIAFVFGRVSVVTLAANLLEVPVSFFVTLATAVLAPLAAVPAFLFLARPLALLVRLACALMLWAARGLASLPFAAVSVQYGYLNLFLLFAALLAAASFAAAKRASRAKAPETPATLPPEALPESPAPEIAAADAGSRPVTRRAAFAACAACVCFLLSAGALSYTLAARGVTTVEALSGGGAVVVSGGRAVILGLPETLSGASQAEAVLERRGVSSVDAAVLLSSSSREARVLAVLEGAVPVRYAYMPAGGGAKTDTGFSPPQAVSVPSRITLPSGAQILLLPDRTGQYLLGQLRCGAASAEAASGGDYSAYNPAALRAALLLCGSAGQGSLAGWASPALASGEAGSGMLNQCAGLGAAVRAAPQAFYTRGGAFTAP